jgi:DNA invertase Pin-like site-specific DNA recombinase
VSQHRELIAVAKRHGWNVAAEFVDHGISGSKGRDKRPQYDALCAGVTRKDFDRVAAWSVDRIGRSLPDLVAFLEELRAKGIDLYLHQQTLDTATPSGRMVFGMCSVFAAFEREMIVERVNAGLARARERGHHARATDARTPQGLAQDRAAYPRASRERDGGSSRLGEP